MLAATQELFSWQLAGRGPVLGSGKNENSQGGWVWVCSEGTSSTSH